LWFSSSGSYKAFSTTESKASLVGRLDYCFFLILMERYMMLCLVSRKKVLLGSFCGSVLWNPETILKQQTAGKI